MTTRRRCIQVLGAAGGSGAAAGRGGAAGNAAHDARQPDNRHREQRFSGAAPCAHAVATQLAVFVCLSTISVSPTGASGQIQSVDLLNVSLYFSHPATAMAVCMLMTGCRGQAPKCGSASHATHCLWRCRTDQHYSPSIPAAATAAVGTANATLLVHAALLEAQLHCGESRHVH